MEVKKLFLYSAIIFTIVSCSNTPERETGEIKTVQLLIEAFRANSAPKLTVDARQLITRKQIDSSGVSVLFVELSSGQNGTLTTYPGQGFGQTWLGADGATITFEKGILKASRGMGDDVMGGTTSMPSWSNLNDGTEYSRTLSYLNGKNKIFSHEYKCKINKNIHHEVIMIWDVNFKVTKYYENCHSSNAIINNVYYLDRAGIVRKSFQYHGPKIGYISTERLDRL